MVKMNNINIIRIAIILPCVALKQPINNFLGIGNCIHDLTLFQRFVFEIVTLLGLFYMFGFIVFNFFKLCYPSCSAKMNELIHKNSR